jgi:hypothetical protein
MAKKPGFETKNRVFTLTDGAGVSYEMSAAMCAVRYVWLPFFVLA